MVGQIPYWVQSLLGGTGGDQDVFARQIVGQRNGAEDMLKQLVRLGQLSRPHRSAGQPSGGRGNNLPAIAAEDVQVVLGHRVFKHLGIHGRCKELGAGTGQNGGGQHIVRQAVGQLGAHIGSGRGDND